VLKITHFDFVAATSAAAAAASNTNTPAAAANATDTARVQLKCDGTVTQGWGSEGETGEWSGYPVPFTPPRNTVYPGLLPLMRTSLLPVVD
jgi:hypothetical protein